MKKKKVVIGIVLFSFVLSSCKMCEDKNKTNPVERVDENILKSKVGRYLQAKGANDAEIRQMLEIEKEDFGEDIGHIVYNGNHYYYEGHDNGWTHSNCGLYAVKRLLFVLGKHGIVDKDLWYRYTDSQLREMDLPTDQNKKIHETHLKTLMEDLGVSAEYRGIYDKYGDEIGDAMTYSEIAVSRTERYEEAKRNLEEFNAGKPVSFKTKEELEEDLRSKKQQKESFEEIKIKHDNKIKEKLNRK